MKFTIEQLGMAYRKAKVDLYYSSNASVMALAEYEENIMARLQSLLEQLNGDDEGWIDNPNFLGTWTLSSKSINSVELDKQREGKGAGLKFSSPAEDWDFWCNELMANGQGRPKAEFRVMAKCSIDFHILAALWVAQVGEKYDGKLDQCSYGNRLRRSQAQDFSRLSLGSFNPYLKPFREWRDRGLDAIRSALGVGKKIVALTGDVSSFYHELQPGFMLSTDFTGKVLGLELSRSDQRLNMLFIRALEAWALLTPLKRGLPVGLPASAVVANLGLIELDRLITKQIVPLYYGRYVDDIILVMENGAGFRSVSELWEWILLRSQGLLVWDEGGRKEIRFKPSYLSSKDKGSRIVFSNVKSKVFMIAGETGLALVDTLERQINERASEWRALPRVPSSAESIGAEVLSAVDGDGEIADNLRKADEVTMRRASFAIKLRDFEAYERDLPPDSWKVQRHAFLRSFCQYVLVLPKFFELSNYLSRVIRLAVSCGDFWHVNAIIEGLEKICERVKSTCDVEIKGCIDDTRGSLEIVQTWQAEINAAVSESILSAFPTSLTKDDTQAWRDHMKAWHPPSLRSSAQVGTVGVRWMQAQQARLFALDLAHLPFRFCGLPAEMIDQRGVPARKKMPHLEVSPAVLDSAVSDGVGILAKWIKFDGLPSGLVFATRPFKLAELFLVQKDAFEQVGKSDLEDVILAIRGFRPSEDMPRFDSRNVLHIQSGAHASRVGIALSSWRTDLNSWVASVKKAADPDVERYARLHRMLEAVISFPRNSRYLVLPELALPAHWFMRVAAKLGNRGISLISGVQYLHSSKGRVHNQIWTALSHDGLGFKSMMVYRQDKQRAAYHEEQELRRIANLQLQPRKSWKIPPIVQHGNVRFSLLVCSELTNISYRAALRGKVDVLFVPEWNQDTDTFSSLVESAALDVHAYIVQCNDRNYGDSRIRAPYKDPWLRDILRVKGGTTDYCLIGEIDIQALREFQSSHRSPAKGFKPVPDGFEICYERRMLPKADGT